MEDPHGVGEKERDLLPLVPDSSGGNENSATTSRKKGRRRRGPLNSELVEEIQIRSEPIKAGKKEEQQKWREEAEKKKDFRRRVLSDAKFQRRNNRLRSETVILDDREKTMYKQFLHDHHSISRWFKSSLLARDAAEFAGLTLEDIMPQTLDKERCAFQAPRTWSSEHRSLVRNQQEKRRKRNLKRVIKTMKEVMAYRVGVSKKREDTQKIRTEREMKRENLARRRREDRHRMQHTRRKNASFRRQEKERRHTAAVEEQIRRAASRLEALALNREEKRKLRMQSSKNKFEALRELADKKDNALDVQREHLERRMQNAAALRCDANKNETLLRRSREKKRRVAKDRHVRAHRQELEYASAKRKREMALKHATQVEVFRLIRERERERLLKEKRAINAARLERVRRMREIREEERLLLEKSIQSKYGAK